MLLQRQLRNGLLTETLFTQARVVLAEWRNDCNTVIRHSKPGGRTLAEIASSLITEHQPQGLHFRMGRGTTRDVGIRSYFFFAAHAIFIEIGQYEVG